MENQVNRGFLAVAAGEIWSCVPGISAPYNVEAEQYSGTRLGLGLGLGLGSGTTGTASPVVLCVAGSGTCFYPIYPGLA